jgi:hypothetical protein
MKTAEFGAAAQIINPTAAWLALIYYGNALHQNREWSAYLLNTTMIAKYICFGLKRLGGTGENEG